ncbi:DNA-directed RNA polymerase subunit P [Candidatus Pacearchaeota archaeon CG_4_9_14_0_2_um_filter_39_13]|nr:DNA-directed RNA polymerase subunit P [Candidatus Pacearchaeota archaeon]PJC44392.1 MAG: DNA-directed RNA polymerase subunit P [Candidatus Pacearchaeota archaeon CG_4_9_14_0_2_um_filter_39_13]
MAQYKCFHCSKVISSKALDKRFACPHCGSKIFYKPRKHIAKVKAI